MKRQLLALTFQRQLRQVNDKGNDSLITYMTVKIFKGGLNCVSLIGDRLMQDDPHVNTWACSQ